MLEGNQNKIIYDLCAGSGAWSEDYLRNGYDVRRITLPENDVHDLVPQKGVYGIIAAPVCAHFSLARTRAKTPRDLKGGMKLVIACLNFIWGCRYLSKLQFWCLENPMGYLRQFLGKSVFTFNPCDFGDRYTKKTDLWGYFNEPIKNPVDLNQTELALNYTNSRKLPSISDITSSTQADRRAITPPGFARAFYEANK